MIWNACVIQGSECSQLHQHMIHMAKIEAPQPINVFIESAKAITISYKYEKLP